MSEVHRYKVVTMLSAAGATIGYDPHGPDVVMAADLDRVTAERDAALAELSEIKESLAYRGSLICRIEGQRDALQQRLTAADERADLLDTALRKIKARLDAYAEADMDMPNPSVEVCQMIADAALKPAEGQLNQCDGCQAGIPVVNGAHRMGKPGAYPDTMSCTAKLYKP